MILSLMWLSLDLIDDKSTSVQVMALVPAGTLETLD